VGALTDRRRLALGDPPTDLAGFPRWRLRKQQRMFRAHTLGLSPWWFASGDAGRFNLPKPHGTCYLAIDVATALRERCGPELVELGLVSADFAARTMVSRLSVPRERQLADACHQSAAHFGVTRELFTIAVPSYTLTRKWAAAFHATGAGGIRYKSRFTTTARANAVALFDAAGERDWPPDPAPLPGTTACTQAGLTVAARPTRRQLRIIEPPS
jgi:RES domain